MLINTHIVALVHEGDLHGVSRDRSGERQSKGSEELHFEAFVNECWSERTECGAREAREYATRLVVVGRRDGES